MSDTALRQQQDAWVARVLGVTPTGGSDDAANVYTSRLSSLMGRAKAAMAGPLGVDLKLKFSESGVFGRKKDFAQANRLLDEAERLLAVGTTPRPEPSRTGAAAAAFAAAASTWEAVRQKAETDLQALERTILAECADEPDFPAIKANTDLLYSALTFMGGELRDKLAAAQTAAKVPAAPGALRTLRDEAREIIDGYLAYIAGDEMLHDIDDNGFVDIAIGPPLTQQLTTIDQQLKALSFA